MNADKNKMCVCVCARSYQYNEKIHAQINVVWVTADITKGTCPKKCCVSSYLKKCCVGNCRYNEDTCPKKCCVGNC